MSKRPGWRCHSLVPRAPWAGIGHFIFGISFKTSQNFTTNFLQCSLYFLFQIIPFLIVLFFFFLFLYPQSSSEFISIFYFQIPHWYDFFFLKINRKLGLWFTLSIWELGICLQFNTLITTRLNQVEIFLLNPKTWSFLFITEKIS